MADEDDSRVDEDHEPGRRDQHEPSSLTIYTKLELSDDDEDAQRLRPMYTRAVGSAG